MIRKSKLAVQSFLLSFMEAIRLLGRFGLLITQNSDLISHFSSLAKLYNFFVAKYENVIFNCNERNTTVFLLGVKQH